MHLCDWFSQTPHICYSEPDSFLNFLYRCSVNHVQLMRLIDSMNWTTLNHFLASPMHLDWICCCCCSCRSNVIFPSGKIPYNCSIIVLPTVADIHGRILLERIQPERCLESLILNLFQMTCYSFAYSFHGFSSPPALAVTLLSDHKHLTSLSQRQLIHLSWAEVIQCGCNYLSEWPWQWLIQSKVENKNR